MQLLYFPDTQKWAFIAGLAILTIADGPQYFDSEKEARSFAKNLQIPVSRDGRVVPSGVAIAHH